MKKIGTVQCAFSLLQLPKRMIVSYLFVYIEIFWLNFIWFILECDSKFLAYSFPFVIIFKSSKVYSLIPCKNKKLRNKITKQLNAYFSCAPTKSMLVAKYVGSIIFNCNYVVTSILNFSMSFALHFVPFMSNTT